MNFSKRFTPSVATIAMPFSLALSALGCGAAADAGEAGDPGATEPTANATNEYRRVTRPARSAPTSPGASTPSSTTSAPTDGTVVDGVVHLGAVTIDENGNIVLNPNAFAPDDDGSDAVGGPSDNVGTPGTLPRQNGGTCPNNAPTSGTCAYNTDQCVFSTPSRTGYCTCIGSAALSWSCH
jgi:hypothetical protein